MLILALDTTTAAGSCAVAHLPAGVDAVSAVNAADILAERKGDPARTQMVRMPRDLQTVLAEAAVALPSIDVFAVAAGPGSFTGLRVGIATMQGLAFAAGKPLIGVSALDALAATASLERGSRGGRIATWVDAWRGEVYTALYDGQGSPLEGPTVERPDAVLARLAGPVLFIGEGVAAARSIIEAASHVEAAFAPDVAPALAGAIARLAATAVARGERPRPEAIAPLYVRRTDAEIARDARTAG